MKIFYTHYSGREIEISLDAALAPIEEAHDGIAETAQAQARRNAETIGRLLAHLVTNNALSVAEALAISQCTHYGVRVEE